MPSSVRVRLPVVPTLARVCASSRCTHIYTRTYTLSYAPQPLPPTPCISQLGSHCLALSPLQSCHFDCCHSSLWAHTNTHTHRALHMSSYIIQLATEVRILLCMEPTVHRLLRIKHTDCMHVTASHMGKRHDEAHLRLTRTQTPWAAALGGQPGWRPVRDIGARHS